MFARQEPGDEPVEPEFRVGAVSTAPPGAVCWEVHLTSACDLPTDDRRSAASRDWREAS